MGDISDSNRFDPAIGGEDATTIQTRADTVSRQTRVMMSFHRRYKVSSRKLPTSMHDVSTGKQLETRNTVCRIIGEIFAENQMSMVTDDAPLSLRVGWTVHESPDAEAVRVLHPCKPSPFGNDARCSGPAVASSHYYREYFSTGTPQIRSSRGVYLGHDISVHCICVRACGLQEIWTLRHTRRCLNLQMHRAVTWGWTFPGNLGTCRVFPVGLILPSIPKLYSTYMHRTGHGECAADLTALQVPCPQVKSNFEIHRTQSGDFKCFQSGARPQTGWGSKTCRTPTPT